LIIACQSDEENRHVNDNKQKQYLVEEDNQVEAGQADRIDLEEDSHLVEGDNQVDQVGQEGRAWFELGSCDRRHRWFE